MGVPFVGRSGKLLDKILFSIGLNREDIYICNVVKCRPPNNRRPLIKERFSALPWLNQQIHLVDPVIILLAGSTAVESVLGLKDAISTLRGNWQNLERSLLN